MNWPASYIPINDPEQQARLAAELAQEMAAGHELFGVPVRAVGRRLDQDDVLFELTDGTGRVAEVHLTWRANDNPPWPCAAVFASLENWIASPHHTED